MPRNKEATNFEQELEGRKAWLREVKEGLMQELKENLVLNIQSNGEGGGGFVGELQLNDEIISSTEFWV